jgi:small subunit ribosomal protein S17
MAINNNEEVDETVSGASGTEATEQASAESNSDDNQAAGNEQNAGGDAGEDTSAPSILQSVVETVTSTVGSVAETVVGGVETLVSKVTGDSSGDEENVRQSGKRAERIGVVASDKMTKTVVVRVDRLVKHPIYRKYIRRKKKFMAHDELGAKIGDKVRIIETRPLSAHKRWRVVEIIQKAEI